MAGQGTGQQSRADGTGRPGAHHPPGATLFDGDTLFALATGKVRASITLVGAYAAEAVAQAIVAAARSAVAAGGLPAGTDVLG